VLFGAANLAILLIVTAVKVYAFTSLWCAYAAIESSPKSSVDSHSSGLLVLVVVG